MEKHGPDFYDTESVFAIYAAHRNRTESPNETMEQPVLWELIGDPNGLDVLDMGCGDARVAKKFKTMGAKSYLGVEGSKKMVAHAQQNLERGFSNILQSWLEEFTPLQNSFDLITSSLVFHYIENLEALLDKAQAALRPGGKIIFSTEHPVITSCNKSLENSPVRQAWVVDDYFQSGARIVNWMGDRVIKYHRSLEEVLTSLKKTGFVLEELREASPAKVNFDDPTLFERRKKIPLFLIISAKKK